MLQNQNLRNRNAPAERAKRHGLNGEAPLRKKSKSNTDNLEPIVHLE
jgi:hypothetical protein